MRNCAGVGKKVLWDKCCFGNILLKGKKIGSNFFCFNSIEIRVYGEGITDEKDN